MSTGLMKCWQQNKTWSGLCDFTYLQCKSPGYNLIYKLRPRIVDVRKTNDQDRESQGFIHLQMGTNRFANQSGTFKTPKQLPKSPLFITNVEPSFHVNVYICYKKKWTFW